MLNFSNFISRDPYLEMALNTHVRDYTPIPANLALLLSLPLPRGEQGQSTAFNLRNLKRNHAGFPQFIEGQQKEIHHQPEAESMQNNTWHISHFTLLLCQIFFKFCLILNCNFL